MSHFTHQKKQVFHDYQRDNIQRTLTSQFPRVALWKQQFEDKIQQPILLRQINIRRGKPQQCFQHSSNYSIYCTVCRKLLCASCMYANLAHRKHRVVPVESATEELKQDIKAFELKLPKTVNEFNAIVDQYSQLLMQLDREYTPLQASIQKFYDKLRETLKKREQQHLNQLKQLKDAAREEIMTWNRQLGRMSNYINEKLNYYKNQNLKANVLPAARGVLQLLTQSSTYISDSFMEKFTFPTNEERIKKVQEEIKLKLDNLMAPIQEKEIKLREKRTTIPKTASTKAFHSVKKNGSVSNSRDERRRQNSSLMALGGTFRR